MLKTKIEKREVEVTKDILCDSCQASCLKWVDTKHTIPLYEYATLTANWGYGSNVRDGQSSESHLCQKCWEQITSNFKNLVIKNNF